MCNLWKSKNYWYFYAKLIFKNYGFQVGPGLQQLLSMIQPKVKYLSKGDDKIFLSFLLLKSVELKSIQTWLDCTLKMKSSGILKANRIFSSISFYESELKTSNATIDNQGYSSENRLYAIIVKYTTMQFLVIPCYSN